MTTDQFLDFWSAHNITIIEALIALILVLAAYISYRLIFFAEPEAPVAAGNANLDSAQIEKTLQKILDASSTRGEAPALAAGPEVEELRQTLKTSEAELNELKTQLAAALAQAGAGAAAGAGGGAGSGSGGEDRGAMENKIHDLEARLAEYEIISEDIADLSRYKEENLALSQKLAALGGGAPPAAAAPPAPAATPAPAPAAAPAAAAPAPAAPVAAAPAPTQAPTPAAPAAAATPSPEVAAIAAAASDDNLMKEFAAAIEGGAKPDALPPETDKLMSEFENFVKKG